MLEGDTLINASLDNRNAIGLITVKPAIEDISKHLKVPIKMLSTPFKNLLYSGIFSKTFDARNDQELLGKGINKTNLCLSDMVTEDNMFNYAW